jgi:CcmD family protein
MDNLGYLFAAYTIIFVVIFLYVLFIWRRQTRLEADLRAMESRLKDVHDELSARASQFTPQSRSAP